MIKAIETEYNGYRFRSRLEARWAVFFDAMGIKYEYEKEGYDLGELGYYLPDFWLPELDMWVEVKGQKPTDLEFELMRTITKSMSCSGIIVENMPSPKYWNGWDESQGYYYEFGEGWYYGYSFTACDECGIVSVGYEGRICVCECNWRTMNHDEMSLDKKRMSNAYRKARSARFEHGEKP